MSGPAKKDALEALHAAMATTMTEFIKSPPEDGKGLAALMEVARKFLADNGIDSAATPDSPTGKLAEAAKQYPFNPADNMSQH